jgi:hypothetical protein
MLVLFVPFTNEVEWFVGLNLMKSRAATITDPVSKIAHLTYLAD